MHYLYMLVDPEEPQHVRYVGVTNDLNKRLTKHIYSSKSYPNGTKKENWIGKVISEGRRPQIVMLDSTDTLEEVFELEVDVISMFTEAGHELTNGTSGGPGFDPKWVNKTGKTLEELWQDQSWIDEKVATFKEYWSNEENRTAQSNRVSEHFSNPENREAVSKALKEYYAENPAPKWTDDRKLKQKSSEAYQKMVADKQSEDHRELMRSRAMEQYSTPESRQASSEHAKKGWANLSPEQRQIRNLKVRLGSNLSWAKKHGRVLELSPKTCKCEEAK